MDARGKACESCEEVASEPIGPPLFHFLMSLAGSFLLLVPGNQASGRSSMACCSAGIALAPYLIAFCFCFSNRPLRAVSGSTLGAGADGADVVTEVVAAGAGVVVVGAVGARAAADGGEAA